MSREVDHILHERSRRSPRRAEMAAVAGALALHLLFVAVAFALPHFKPAPQPLEFVPVQIIPAQALGVRRPAPPKRRNPAPAPETPAPQTEEPEAKPEPQKPAAPDDIPVLPSPDDKKKPVAKPTPPPSPASPTSPDKSRPDKARQETGRPSDSGSSEGPAGTAPGETGDQLGRRGGAQGNPLGTTAFGSELGGVDNPDFTYGYYLDRLLSLIDAQWVRPSMGAGIKTVIFFRIHRDGSMTDLRVEQSSGYNSFDLAALRAVQNAAPFPLLPRAFQHDSLGVNLIVR
ncbi:MAG: TonB family protein [Acidobacteriota bacterium]